MEGPEIKIRSTWQILNDASKHFVRNLGYFFLLSILPLVLSFLAVVVGITYLDDSTAIILVALPIALFIYGFTLLISWETMCGAKPHLGIMATYTLRTAWKFAITLALFWAALVLVPLVVIFFIHRVVQFITETRKVGAFTSLILFALTLSCIPLLIAFFPELRNIDTPIFPAALVLIVTILSIPSILLMLVPAHAFFQRCNIIRAFTSSISLGWGYWLHILPFVLLEILSILAIAIMSMVLSNHAPIIFPLALDQLTFVIAGMIYVITLPFFINLRVFYFQDLVLRKQGYNALLRVRECCNCLSRRPEYSVGLSKKLSNPGKAIST